MQLNQWQWLWRCICVLATACFSLNDWFLASHVGFYFTHISPFFVLEDCVRASLGMCEVKWHLSPSHHICISSQWEVTLPLVRVSLSYQLLIIGNRTPDLEWQWDKCPSWRSCRPWLCARILFFCFYPSCCGNLERFWEVMKTPKFKQKWHMATCLICILRQGDNWG